MFGNNLDFSIFFSNIMATKGVTVQNRLLRIKYLQTDMEYLKVCGCWVGGGEAITRYFRQVLKGGKVLTAST